MLAKRWLGREAILIDVRRADDDIALARSEQYHNRRIAEKVGSSELNMGCHMAAVFRSSYAEHRSLTSGSGENSRGLELWRA